jgi:hypothetical protein
MSKYIPASPELEAFYSESLSSIAAIARKHGDKAKVIDMVQVLAKGVGMLLCACFPNERDLARQIAIENIDEAVKRHAEGANPPPMSKQ